MCVIHDTDVQIVRYSALVGGIAYGILHRRSLQAKYDERAHQKAVRQQEDLIKKAKAEYAKLQAAKAPAPSANGTYRALTQTPWYSTPRTPTLT